MGCSSSKPKNDRTAPRPAATTSQLLEPRGQCEQRQLRGAPKRQSAASLVPAPRNQRNGNLGASQAGNRADSNNCFPELVKFRLDESEVLLTRKYMDGGDVRTLLETRKIELSWKKEKISIAIDIAEALAYMHSRSPKIIHRDLKSRNVLLNSSMVAKLSDFGLSRNRTYEETLTAGVGTVRWTAPEVMLGDNYSEQADVYSFGVFDPALRPDSESVVQMLNDARVQLQAMS
ncbi:Protein kinase-like domain [Phytophthora cactorum]|nr:Protein kinase-like domain [Phytophthora cactorum]